MWKTFLSREKLTVMKDTDKWCMFYFRVDVVLIIAYRIEEASLIQVSGSVLIDDF